MTSTETGSVFLFFCSTIHFSVMPNIGKSVLILEITICKYFEMFPNNVELFHFSLIHIDWPRNLILSGVWVCTAPSEICSNGFFHNLLFSFLLLIDLICLFVWKEREHNYYIFFSMKNFKSVLIQVLILYCIERYNAWQCVLVVETVYIVHV